MFHSIEFTLRVRAGMAIPGQRRLEKIVLQTGTRLRAEIRPYVAESDLGPLEVADLFLEDGSAVHNVNFASFRFLDD
jgi:hypothetical protein